MPIHLRPVLHLHSLRWIGLGAILLLLLLAGLPAAAQDQPAVVRSDPAVLEVSNGQTVTLNVVLADAREVYGIDVSATFDPQLVEVVDADPAREGVQFSPGTFPQPDFVARNVADNQTGALHYAITQVNPSEPVNGAGVVFSVQLRAKTASGEGSFTISAVDLTDRDGVLLGVQPESSQIRVISGGTGAPPPTATSPAAPTAIPTATSPATAVPPAPSVVNPSPVPATPPAPVSQAAAQAQSASPELTAVPPATQSGDLGVGASAAQHAAATPTDTVLPSATAAPELVAPQAVAAAPIAESAAPGTPDVLQPAAPSQDNTAAPAMTPASAQPQPAASQVLSQRHAGAERSPAVDPSQLLLIVGIAALTVAAVLSALLLVVLRR